MGRFGLGKWVVLALGGFGPGSFRPKSIPKCSLLRTGRQTKIDRQRMIDRQKWTDGRQNKIKRLVKHIKIVSLIIIKVY